MQAHQQRVVAEKRELDERLAKLRDFVEKPSPVFQKLPYDEQHRLIRQQFIMKQYSDVLAERIQAFPEEPVDG